MEVMTMNPMVFGEIKFGSFENVATLENKISVLQQEKEQLVKTLIDRDNILQKEKDTYMSEMSIIMHNTKQKYEEHYNSLESMNIQLKSELDNLKELYIQSQLSVKALQNQNLPSTSTDILKNKLNESGVQTEISKSEIEGESGNEKKMMEVATDCSLIQNDEYQTLKTLCSTLEEHNKKFEADNKHLKEDYKKLYDNFKKLQSENNKLQNTYKKLQDENKELSKPKPVVKVATTSIGITCAFPNDLDYIVKTQIKTIEKLSHDLNNERDLSCMMSVSNAEKDKFLKEKDAILKEKDKLIEGEKSLRMDLQYLVDTIRMYLEIEIMKLSAEINANGLRGFTAAAFNMYRGYCEGVLEKMITEAVETRTKIKF